LVKNESSSPVECVFGNDKWVLTPKIVH
jgi:hypothetical protein